MGSFIHNIRVHNSKQKLVDFEGEQRALSENLHSFKNTPLDIFKVSPARTP